MYKFLFSPFYYLMDLYVHNNDSFYFDEITLGEQLSKKTMLEVESFRASQFKESQSYLIPSNSIEKLKDRRVDSYSYQFIVRSKDDQSIIACMRLTPWPFESSEYTINNSSSDIQNFLEISRLVVKKKGVGIGKKLLICAGNFAISKTSYDGFVAICKEERLGMFSSFGLLSKDTFLIPERGNSKYHLISSSFFLISRTAMMRFIKPKLALKA